MLHGLPLNLTEAFGHDMRVMLREHRDQIAARIRVFQPAAG